MGKTILRRKKEKNIVKKKIRIMILLIILGIIINLAIGVYKESKIKLKENGEESIIEKISKQESKNEMVEIVELVNIPERYLGFKVAAQLEVPKINLKTYILEDYEEEGMKVCASKYWGPAPNELGNFCIAGHNYEQENMFNHLIDLEVGDKLYLSDNENGKVDYTIYDIYRVKPNNIEPLNQETNGEKIVTLITCVNYSRNRLIVQAR